MDLLNLNLPDLPSPKDPAREIAILGDHEDDLTVARGYLQVAGIAAIRWSVGGPDSLLMPILYNYRHAIELMLKWQIRMAARRLVQDGYTQDGYTQENLSETKLDEKLSSTHNIKNLVDRLDRYLRLLRPDEEYVAFMQIDAIRRIDRASRGVLDWLDSEDVKGEAFRYTMVRPQRGEPTTRPERKSFPAWEKVNDLHKIAYVLFHVYSGFLAAQQEVVI